MATPRDVLNELKWRFQALGPDVVVWYLHRGAPDDRVAVRGSDIRALHRSFFEVEAPLGATMIPYHRVLRIDREGHEVWRRRAPPRPSDEAE